MATLLVWLALSLVSSVHGTVREPLMFRCSDGFTIPTYLICDGIADCMDGADEQQRNCALQVCSPLDFDCGPPPTPGRQTQCIPLSWKCDGRTDCWNGKDERDCAQAKCAPGEFRCNNTRCISSSYLCDRYNDCGDNTDENAFNCEVVSPIACSPTEFSCQAATGPRCIPLSWKCDSEMDCDDNSDESTFLCFGSTTRPSCPLGTFNCTDSSGSSGGYPSCIIWNRVCDGTPDCNNGKDERCPTASACPSGSFHCTEGNLCIREEWKCDGLRDCPDGSDEDNCQVNCTVEQFSCITGGCVPRQFRCDGKLDCTDGTDEYMCPKPKLLECSLNQFTCADGLQCVGTSFVCAGSSVRCHDGSDVMFCNQSRKGPCLQSSECEQLCMNVSNNTHTCGCSHGYRVNTTNRRTCVDIDECSQVPPVCSQLCTNTPGSYTCSCSPGYVRDYDKCRAQDPTPPYLLFAYRASIEKMNITTTSTHTSLIPGLSNGIAIAYHYSRQYLFISDMTQGAILRGSLTARTTSRPPQLIAIISSEIGSIDGLAVDWINDKIYWTDSQLKHVEVADLDGMKRVVLFANGLDKPRAIVVDPAQGLLFWTDWGSTPSISRASMDGTNRTLLHTQYLGWPNALTMDYPTRTIYWADAYFHSIESSSTDGSNRWVLASGSGVVQHPYGMAIFENWIYWSDWTAGAVLKVGRRGNNGTGAAPQVIQAGLNLPMVVQVVHPAVQRAGRNPCAVNNSGCQYLCLLKEGGEGYGCACPTGVLLAKDNHSCQDINTFILFTHRVGIRRMSLDTPELVTVPLPVYNLSVAGGLAWDLPSNSLFWADRFIYVANLNGSNQRPLITSNLGTPVALAVDWQTRKLYWTDSGLKRIEVSNLDGSQRCILVSSGLDMPRDIAVHPTAGYMFWTDWGIRPLIGRSALDGSGRIDLVTTNLKYINALAIDFDTNTLYWADAFTDVIETSDLNGRNRTVFLSNLLHPYGMALYGGYLYWTDWTSQTIQRVNKTTGRGQTLCVSSFRYMNVIQVVNRDRLPGLNPCAIDNGGCSHLCLTKPGPGGQTVASCLCPTGYGMLSYKTCASQINHYLLIAAGSTIHQLSLDVSYVADIVLPITGIVNAVSVDEDIMEGVVYWSDDVASGIYKAPLTGGPAQVVIQRQIFQPMSLAVDWIGRKLYWVDMMNQRLEVANLDGSSARVLLSASQDVGMPRGLALDLKYTYLYWTDDTSVNRVAMDGTMMTTLIRNQCEPTSITITDRWIVWTDPCILSIARANADTGAISRGGITAPNQLLSGVAVFNNSLYWIDRQDGSLHRAFFDSSSNMASTGADGVILLSNMATDVREVRLVKKSDLAIKDQFQYPCAQDRGCGSLCLPNQWTTLSQYTCACPTGIKLNPDGRTCPKIPSTFLLVTVADTIVQISLDTLSQDILVLMDSLQNPLAIDFLLATLESGRMFWVDSTVNAILSANLLGGPPTTLVKGAGVPQGLAVDWIASNIYWTAQGDLQRPAGIYVVRTNGSFPRAIITSQIVNPRSIAVHPTMGLLFWVNQASHFRIERCNLDGSNRMVIVNSTGAINDIIVDYPSNMLLWVDNENHNFRTSNLDGTNQSIFIPISSEPRFTAQPFGMAKLGNQLFWTEWQTRSLYRALQTGKSSFLLSTVAPFKTQQPNSIAVVNRLRPGELTPLPSSLPCSVNNGDCQQLCLASNSTHRVCGCSTKQPSCNETFGVPQHLLPPPQASSMLPSISPSSLVIVMETYVVPSAVSTEDSVNAMLLGVTTVMSIVMLVVLAAIIFILVTLACRYKDATIERSPRINRQLHMKPDSANNSKVLYRLNNTKECVPLKNINSQPQGNLNKFKGEELEYYDTSSVKVPHRIVQQSIPDNPPTKPNGCVVVDVIIEAQEDFCETKPDAQKTKEDGKVPGTEQMGDPKGQDSTMEPTGGGVTKPPSVEEPNSTKEPEGAKPCTDQGTRGEPRPPIAPRPTTPTTPHPITPRGANKAALRFNLPPEPLSVLPTTPPPAIPPRSPKVPPTTPKENGPEQV